MTTKRSDGLDNPLSPNSGGANWPAAIAMAKESEVVTQYHKDEHGLVLIWCDGNSDRYADPQAAMIAIAIWRPTDHNPLPRRAGTQPAPQGPATREAFFTMTQPSIHTAALAVISAVTLHYQSTPEPVREAAATLGKALTRQRKAQARGGRKATGRPKKINDVAILEASKEMTVSEMVAAGLGSETAIRRVLKE